MKSSDDVDLYAFTSLQDVDQRLRKSICKHTPTGKWVNIEQVSKLPDSREFTFVGTNYFGDIISGSIKELDYSCPKVGMFTDHNEVFLAERVPVRQYKGGINPQSVRFRCMYGEDASIGFFHCSGFYSMLDNNYPSLSNVIPEYLRKDGTNRCAVRRFNWISVNDFKIVTLFFMRDKVISFTNKGKDITPSNINSTTAEFNRQYLVKDIDLIRSVLQ